MNKSRKVFYSSLCFILGIAVAEIVAIPFFIAYCFLLLSLVFLSFVWSKNNIKWLMIFLIFFLLGIIRLGVDDIKEHTLLNNEKLIFTGIIIKDPRQTEKYQDLVVSYKKEKILVKADLYSSYVYGDKIEVECKINALDKNTSYGRFLLKDKISYICYYPKIKFLSHGRNIFIFEKLLSIKHKINQSIKENLPYPESEILSGFVMGDTSQIPSDLKQKFSQIGVSHIIAISGSHLVIISAILFSLCLSLGFWRQQAFYIVVSLVWLYILLIGWPASAVRSGVMISVFLWGKHLGRISGMINSLLLAGAIMLLLNPHLLFYDIGFQLSFLAVLGLMYLMPPLSLLFQKWPNLYGIKEILIMTLAAQIITLPFSIYYFGNIPLISFVANLIIIPFVPLVLVLGILMTITGLIWSTGGILLGYIIWPFLSLFVKAVYFLTNIPYSYLYVEEINFAWVILFYLVLVLVLYKINKKYAVDYL